MVAKVACQHVPTTETTRSVSTRSRSMTSSGTLAPIEDYAKKRHTPSLRATPFLEGTQSTGPEIPSAKRAEAVSSAERVPARAGCVGEHRNQAVAGVTC